MEYFETNKNIKMPKIIYGTAWKKEKTADLVELALKTGFRGIDTACQPKHYNEPLVGEGIDRVIKSGDIQRNELFVQTKFTPVLGQDPEDIPYDPKLSLREQVPQSFEVSQKNLRTQYIDSLVLHSPMAKWQDLKEVWSAMETLVDAGNVGQLGISNCYDLEVLNQLYDEAKHKPSVVQNRFYSETQYDVGIRNFCSTHNMYYQSFWTLTANPQILAHENVLHIAKKKNKTPAQILFRYLTQVGVAPLTGTSSEKHMREDLAIFTFHLNEDELEDIKKCGLEPFKT